MEDNQIYCGNINCPVRKYESEGQFEDDAYFDNLHLDEGIKDIVITLIKNGVETYQSCEGGQGHSYPWPTVEFRGSPGEALRALSVAIDYGLPIRNLKRVWNVLDGFITDTYWEMIFWPPKDSPLWDKRDAIARSEAAKDVAQLSD